MNQTSLTILGIVLTSFLSSWGAMYQSNKANDEKESQTLLAISTEFKSVKVSVDNFSSQLNTLNMANGIMQSEVRDLKDWRKDITKRVRDVEVKVK